MISGRRELQKRTKKHSLNANQTNRIRFIDPRMASTSIRIDARSSNASRHQFKSVQMVEVFTFSPRSRATVVLFLLRWMISMLECGCRHSSWMNYVDVSDKDECETGHSHQSSCVSCVCLTSYENTFTLRARFGVDVPAAAGHSNVTTNFDRSP